MPQKSISIVSLIMALLLAIPALADEKKDKPQDKPAAEKSADENIAVDPYAVPEGTPRELKEFITKIIRNMPQDDETRKKARAGGAG